MDLSVWHRSMKKGQAHHYAFTLNLFYFWDMDICSIKMEVSISFFLSEHGEIATCIKPIYYTSNLN